ncbi:hypothetical protein V5O48_014331 [Marasmius crinis-equi]|uniref:Fe2OG dioxygenase domain-containing protein n=1 Tax=Marasmius crinis-equi TaxID=585013 RepID=A0ABR3EY01_9AGAR
MEDSKVETTPTQQNGKLDTTAHQNGTVANGKPNGDHSTDNIEFYEIPVIDWRLSETDKPRFLRELRDAMINIGFLYLGNPPVPKDVIERVKEMAPKFFSLPPEIKDTLHMRNSPHFHGYLKVDASVTNDRGYEYTDNREQFNYGGDSYYKWKEGDPEHLKLRGEALWPPEEDLPGFKETMITYYNHLEELSFKFTRLVSEALGLAPDALDILFGQDRHLLQPRAKVMRYPGSTIDGKVGSGVGAHVDGSFLTYLLQITDHKTLQVKNLSGDWIPAPPKEDTFVINLGKTLEKATRRVLPATPHRVLAPVGPARYSLGFFSSVGFNVRLSDYDFDFPQEVLDMKIARDKKLGVSSEFQFREKDHELSGDVVLSRKLRSHADVAQRFYPKLFPQYYPDGMPEKPMTGRREFK